MSNAKLSNEFALPAVMHCTHECPHEEDDETCACVASACQNCVADAVSKAHAAGQRVGLATAAKHFESIALVEGDWDTIRYAEAERIRNLEVKE